MTTARTDAGVRRKPAPERHLPGEEGMWVFIFGDMTVFALLFAVYLYYRGQDTELFNSSQLELNQTFGVVNTLVLLTSSLLVVTAVQALRRDARQLARWLTYGAILCGFVFVINKVIEYSDKVSHGIVPATNQFFMYFYVMTGLHLFHVAIGLVLLFFVIKLTKRPTLEGRESSYVEGSACFWHMVDLLWIVIFPLLYLVK